LLLLGKHTLDVDLNDLLLFNEELGQLLMERPGECIPLVSFARALNGIGSSADVSPLLFLRAA
jgi:hypothetical protein